MLSSLRLSSLGRAKSIGRTPHPTALTCPPPLSGRGTHFRLSRRGVGSGAAPLNQDVFDAMAREILMVDEQNRNLTDRYVEVLQKGLPQLPREVEKKDVLVIGAGMAGLCAATVLRRSGFNVTVLEANDNRVGGRVKTFRKQGSGPAPFKDPLQYAEAGAMRLPTSHKLVDSIIKANPELAAKLQPHYYIDIDRTSTNPSDFKNNTWVRANGVQYRRHEYQNPDSPQEVRTLGFPNIDGKLTASDLLTKALRELNELTDITKPIPAQIKGWKHVLEQFDDFSMLRFLRESAKYSAEQIQFIGTLQNLTSRLHLSFLHSYIDTFLISPGTRYHELQGGMWQIPEALAKPIQDSIVMDSRVVELRWSDSNHGDPKAVHKGRPGVYVRTVSEPAVKRGQARPSHSVVEREFTADFAITTIPFTAMRIIDTQPQFSYHKNRAIIELHYDSATKVLLEFSQRFWEWNEQEWEQHMPGVPYRGHDSKGGFSVSDSVNRFIYYPSNKVPGSEGGVMLASYTWSDDACRWDSIPESERYAIALQELVKIYGAGIKKFYTGRGQTQSWMNDYYALGEAAVFSPGQISTLHPFIQAPEGPVHFAGEHTSLKHAWIEGAVESGIRTALEIYHRVVPAAAVPAGTPPAFGATRVASLAKSAGRPSGKHSASGTPSRSFSSAARPQAVRASSSGTTVAQYLKVRLEQLGLDRLFTIAGNYTAPFLDTILEDKSPIQVTGVSSELVAGYAADGYARFRGIAAVAVTYGVGAFSILNPIVGSDVENIPVVLINGGPTDKEVQNNKRAGLLYSHFTANPDADLEVYRKTTAAAVKITNAVQAPYQIDSALSACVSEMRPVYIEVAEDVWRSPCAAPEGALTRTVTRLSRSNTDQAVDATVDLIHANASKGPPAFWVGHEAHRLGVTDKLLALINDTKTQFFTSLMGKSIISEDHPLYLGVYSPTAPPPVKDLADKHFGSIIGLGAWTTGKDVSNSNVMASNVALVSQGGAFVGPTFYPTVPLGDFLDKLREKLLHPTPAANKERKAFATLAKLRPQLLGPGHLLKGSEGLPYDAFYSVLNDWVKKTSPITVVDASFPLLGAQSLHISKPNNFVASAAWLAIGYAPPSAIGVKCANPSSRVVALTGDGAFQETCQAVSSYAHLGHNTVIFVLANGVYGVEQLLVNPNPFRKNPATYTDPLENAIYPYNHLHPWKYEKLADVFGGTGLLVTTVDELRAALVQIDSRPNDCFIVHVRVPMLSVPGSLNPDAAVGEDEKSNPHYPPAKLF